MKKLFIFYVLLQNYFLFQAEQPITLFCHGIVDNQSQSKRFQEVLESPIETFNFMDAQAPKEWDLNTLIFQSCSLFGKFVNRNNMFMGHGQDIQTLAKQIDATKKYILYGVSRGGTAAINYIAEYNPSNIKALILDATPADMISPIETLQYIIGYKFAPHRLDQEIIFNTIFPGYELNSTPPIQNISHIQNKHIPICIVHSVEDTRVSIASAWQLYLAFKHHGFTDVYLCQLEHGKHSFCLQGSDKNIYLQAIHSFYKKYHFTYNEKYATMDLAMLQPSINEIKKKLHDFQHTLEKIYNKKQNQLKTSMIALGIGIIIAGGYQLESLHRKVYKQNVQSN